jgi:hypothetical protein
VASRGNFFRAKDSALQEFVCEVFVGVGRHLPIGSQKPGFGANHNFVARESLSEKLLQRSAHGTLAALKAIINSRVDDVAAIFYSGNDRRGVGGVCGTIGLAELSSDAYGRKNEPAWNFTEVASGGAAFEARGIAQSAFGRGETSFAFFGYA